MAHPSHAKVQLVGKVALPCDHRDTFTAVTERGSGQRDYHRLHLATDQLAAFGREHLRDGDRIYAEGFLVYEDSTAEIRVHELVLLTPKPAAPPHEVAGNG